VPILLATSPEVVGSSYRDADFAVDERHHLRTVGIHAHSTSGVIGRPSLATTDKGRNLLKSFQSSSNTIWRQCAPDNAACILSRGHDRSVAIRTLVLIQLMPSLTDLALGLVTLAVRCRAMGARRSHGRREPRSQELDSVCRSPVRPSAAAMDEGTARGSSEVPALPPLHPGRASARRP
jgi:hypothetical protein